MTSAYELESGDGPFDPGWRLSPGPRLCFGWNDPPKQPPPGDTWIAEADPDPVDPEVWAAIVRAESEKPPEPRWEDDLTLRARFEAWCDELRRRVRMRWPW